MAESIAAYCNYDKDGYPIVLYYVRIMRGKLNYRKSDIQQRFTSIYSKYGQVWAYNPSGDTLLHIGYDNEQSRNLAAQNEDNTKFDGQELSVVPGFSKLYSIKSLVPLKLKYLNVDINELTNCDNYWNKKLYPEYIVEHGLKHGVSSIRARERRFHIQCYHKHIGYPFAIHLASENRSKQNILCVRPMTKHEIFRMVFHLDVSLLKTIVTNASSFGIDWRNYTIKCGTLGVIAKWYDDPLPKIRYMIDVIKCDPKDPKHELLTVAANRHDLELINVCLDEWKCDPLSRNRRWGATALDECKYAWNTYLEMIKMDPANIIDFNIEAAEGVEPGNDDMKIMQDNHKSYDTVYIRSILLYQFLYIQMYESNICFVNVAEPFKSFAEFALECIDGKRYLIKIERGCKSHERICSFKGDKFINSDFVLTANVEEGNLGFVELNEFGKATDNQCWIINKEIKGNDEGYTFSVKIGDTLYQLIATADARLDLRESTINKEDDNKMEEGSDFNEVIKSWFMVVKDHEFKKISAYEWRQMRWDRSLLKGDRQSCRRIHDAVVKKLEEAIKIQKLHGNAMNDDKKEKEENEVLKYKAENVRIDDNLNRYPTIGNEYNQVSKPRKKRMNPPMYPPSNHNLKINRGVNNRYPTIGHGGNDNYDNNKYQGICKKWNDMKGYGFIIMNNGNGDVFVHKSEIKSGDRLYLGENVEFNIVTQYDGRRKAINVDIVRINDDNHSVYGGYGR